MIIDTHSHLQFNAFKDDVGQVIKRTREAGIRCINVGTKYETSKNAVELAKIQGEGFFAAIGLHPIYAAAEFVKTKTDPDEGEFLINEQEFEKEKYKKLAESKKVVAIGEIGLDYYYKPKTATKLAQFKEKQKQVFVQQLDFARELNLPVILHCRMAHDEVIEILQQRNERRGVIHCFTGTLEQALKYVAMDFYIGINGIIFKLPMDEVIKNISLENMVVETDCPYLTPVPEGNKRNEPIFIKHTIQKIAELKNINVSEIETTTTQNAKKLFNLS
jgi:TatD DNase family protein